MQNYDIEKLKEEYLDIPIPNELDFVVKRTLKDCGVSIGNRQRKFKSKKYLGFTAIACFLIIIVAANTSQAFAETTSNLPVVGGIIKILTFREYTVNEQGFKVKIDVPSIQGLTNKNLQTSLNEKYLNEDKQLYNKFMSDMAQLKKEAQNNKSGTTEHESVTSGYKVKTDNSLILSVERYIITQAGDTGVQKEFDTIDKQKQILITLPSLFKDDSYVNIISQNIISQMQAQMKAESYKMYFIGKNAQYVKPFEKISKNQQFYINNDGKLVISFDKGDVAPAVMGDIEFVIPTKVLNNILVGHEYIK